MRRVKELLRLAHELGYSKRQIALSIRMPKTTVGDYLAHAAAAGLRYAEVAGMSEEAVEALLFQRARAAADAGLGVGRAWQARCDAGLGRRSGGGSRASPAAPGRLQLQMLWGGRRGMASSSLIKPDGVSHATAERLEPIPRCLGSREHAYR